LWDTTVGRMVMLNSTTFRYLTLYDVALFAPQRN